MCANENVYLGKMCAQMNHILSKMCANVLPPIIKLALCILWDGVLDGILWSGTLEGNFGVKRKLKSVNIL